MNFTLRLHYQNVFLKFRLLLPFCSPECKKRISFFFLTLLKRHGKRQISIRITDKGNRQISIRITDMGNRRNSIS